MSWNNPFSLTQRIHVKVEDAVTDVSLSNSCKTDDQVRHRVVEPPIGRRVGYHELGDEKEEGDIDWMLGEASNLSGAGSRGSRNWMLTALMPVLVRKAVFELRTRKRLGCPVNLTLLYTHVTQFHRVH